MKEFEGKVLVITGGANGIGKAIAKEGLNKGMKVLLNDICSQDLQECINELQPFSKYPIKTHQSDVSKIEGMQSLLDFAIKTFERVDMFVNNAGIAISAPV